MLLTNKNTSAVIVLLTVLFSCSENGDHENHYFLSDHIDTTISPGDNFFEYATGNWLKQHPIPDDESSWGIGNVVTENIFHVIRKINVDAEAKHLNDGSIGQQIGDFWYSGMDTANIEKSGLSPLQSDLDKIASMHAADDLVRVAAELHNKGINVLFADAVGQDDKNSTKMMYWIWQGGLLLPDRDYYFNTDAATVGTRGAFKEYIAKTLRRLDPGNANVDKRADAVFELEKKLAGKSRKLGDLRDPEANYHKMDIKQLQALAPKINWSLYTKGIGIANLDSLIVGQPEFLSSLSEEVIATSLDTWKDYLRVQVIHAMAPYLDSSTYRDYFTYRSKLYGVPKQRPRWKRVLQAQANAMGEAVGELFVKDYFNERTKDRYVKMVEAVRSAFQNRIEHLSWMSDTTKQKALMKLSSMTYKVGYPDKWKDFSALKIDRESYVLNVQRANTWWHQREINKLGRPVDKTEWKMTPQTYDAYYSPSNNEILLPAAIFIVPGKKDEELDDAFVYGNAAAATIGHEITHGFDDQGGQYDAMGNLSGWWKPSDSAEFADRAKKIIAQFNEFMPVDTLHINGDATQGENIADLGGVLLGLDAYKQTDEYKKGELSGGFTPLQRFFLGYSFGWTFAHRKELASTLLMSDVHAPPRERVNGPMVNVPEFYEAFNINKGDKMYREDSLRVNIW